MAPAPHAPGLMIAILLAPVLLAGCLGDDLPELPDQLRVRDADLPGLTMYVNVTEEDDLFHLYAVTVNEGEATYTIQRANPGDEHRCSGAPYSSRVERANGDDRPPEEPSFRDSCTVDLGPFEPGNHHTLERTWPHPEVHPSKPGTYIWKVGFRIEGEPHERPDRLIAHVVLDVPASMVHPVEGNATSDKETGSGDASGS